MASRRRRICSRSSKALRASLRSPSLMYRSPSSPRWRCRLFKQAVRRAALRRTRRSMAMASSKILARIAHGRPCAHEPAPRRRAPDARSSLPQRHSCPDSLRNISAHDLDAFAEGLLRAVAVSLACSLTSPNMLRLTTRSRRNSMFVGVGFHQAPRRSTHHRQRWRAPGSARASGVSETVVRSLESCVSTRRPGRAGSLPARRLTLVGRSCALSLARRATWLRRAALRGGQRHRDIEDHVLQQVEDLPSLALRGSASSAWRPAAASAR